MDTRQVGCVQEAIKTVSSKSKDKTVYLLGESEDGKVSLGCFMSEAAR